MSEATTQRLPSAARSSLRGFADAMANANRWRNVLKRRYGYSDEQIKAIADATIRKERQEYEQQQIRQLGEMLRAAKRKKREVPNAERPDF
jgi:hypothetical protein